MTYVKLDDGFFRHPKVVSAGRDARFLYLAGLCYCGANLTDGLIPAGALRVLAAEVEIKNGPAAAKQLVAAGLWEACETGYRVATEGPYSDSARPPAHEWRALRTAVFDRDDYTCQYCGRRGVRLECDHVVPVSRGGSSEHSNLVTACFECNRSKRNKTAEEWLV